LAYKDRVTIGTATVDDQIIGSEAYMSGFTLIEPFDGILTGSNQGEVSSYNTTPKFMDNLYAAGSISEPVSGVYIAPFVDGEENTTEISFGGVDPSKFTGASLPRSTTPTNEHWNFMASSLSWGNITVIPPIYARMDCGVLYILIPTETTLSITDSVANASLDSTDSQLVAGIIFPSNMTVDKLPSLDIGLGNLSVSIVASYYVVPESAYAPMNITDDGQIHTWLCPGGPSLIGLGQKALEHICSAYDSASYNLESMIHCD
ncbi:aspartic peptidase domain-containing protein, partial [Rhodofomes roseus]